MTLFGSLLGLVLVAALTLGRSPRKRRPRPREPRPRPDGPPSAWPDLSPFHRRERVQQALWRRAGELSHWSN